MKTRSCGSRFAPSHFENRLVRLVQAAVNLRPFRPARPAPVAECPPLALATTSPIQAEVHIIPPGRRMVDRPVSFQSNPIRVRQRRRDH